MKELISKLKQEHFFKLIMGLGNSDTKSIKSISAVYAAAGVDMFDLTPSRTVYEAVYEGIKTQNLNVDDFFFCVSFSLGDDPHGRKAHINEKKCIKCLKCLKKCPQDAIVFDKEYKKVFINQEKCIGCGKCGFCSAISFSKEELEIIGLTRNLKSEYKIDCIELHVSTLKFQNIKKVLKKIKTEFPEMVIGICASREKLSDSKLKKLIDKTVKIVGEDNLVFQADGLSMSGSKDDYSSTLQAVATAQAVQDLGVNILLSGGTNSKTYKLAQQCNVKISGVSVGSYGRNLIKEEIQNPEIWYNNEVFDSALKKAKLLVDSVKK